MNRVLTPLMLVAALVASPAAAQEAGPVNSSMLGLLGMTTSNLTRTAEMLDAEMYAYRPTEEVRTVGQILAHVANANYMFCSLAAGTDNPNSENFEETRTTKEGIVEALAMAFEYCQGVSSGMSDEAGTAMRNVFGNEMAASAVLAFNVAHNYEHYGNLVTYMRINGIVPPSSM